jgi:hypothetical protein
MLRAKQAPRSRSRNVIEGHDDTRGTNRRPSFRPKVLPLIIATSLGLVGAAFVASRDIARAQPTSASSVKTNSIKHPDAKPAGGVSGQSFEAQIAANTSDLFNEGRNTFRFDTFADEDFWGGTLQLHQAIEGSAFGGVGPGISPRTALDLGLKVDADALHGVQGALQSGGLDLDSPATTLALLKANAVVGLTGFFNSDGSLKSVGIQCALCHSTVDNSVAPGIGHRLDGWANRDLDVGKIVASAPNLTQLATLLGVSEQTD